MATERRYNQNAYLKTFTAVVRACEKQGNRYAVLLDQTAFFPEGGGQGADLGTLGGANVIDVQETPDRRILHRTDAPLPVGETVHGILDWKRRWRHMQDHSGEHIVSGIVHRLYGYENVGFHLGEDGVTFDFSGELTRSQLDEIERMANEVIWSNVPVTAYYPEPEELENMSYRSKLELTENVRIVTIEGVDVCACCAPHVKHTGEIGLIKLLDFMRHRGGVRVHMLAGTDALEDYRARYYASLSVSNMLSAPQSDIAYAVERSLDQLEAQRQSAYALRRELIRVKSEAVPQSDGAVCIFENALDTDSIREIVNAAMERCGLAAAFYGEDGAYRYIIGSRQHDLRAASKAINSALNGRGGGKPNMIQGSSAATREEIELFFKDYQL